MAITVELDLGELIGRDDTTCVHIWLSESVGWIDELQEARQGADAPLALVARPFSRARAASECPAGCAPVWRSPGRRAEPPSGAPAWCPGLRPTRTVFPRAR